ncbi:MAG: hypothetical protein ABSD98_03220 [Candidatus Korobacteraceae bacterium]|jgi:hypothetical protein
MPDWLKSAWTDSVWSKVIAGLIVAGIVSVLANMRFKLFARIKERFSPKLAVHVRVSFQENAHYPIKIYVEFRNDMVRCIEVSLARYEPDAVTIKPFVPATLQIFFRSWLPTDEGVDRIALYPGQRGRAWVAADPSKFTAAQVEGFVGRIGTLIIKINGRDFPIPL